MAGRRPLTFVKAALTAPYHIVAKSGSTYHCMRLQTSSPSYLLMASLDAARAAAQAPGAWDAPLEAARLARAGLRALPGLLLLEDCAPAGAGLGLCCGEFGQGFHVLCVSIAGCRAQAAGLSTARCAWAAQWGSAERSCLMLVGLYRPVWQIWAPIELCVTMWRCQRFHG